MNIAFITEDIFGIGGVQRVVSTLASALASENNVSVICIKKGITIDRNIYSLDSKVDILNPEQLKKINSKQYFRKMLRVLNKKYFGMTNIIPLEFMYITKNDQRYLIDYINSKNFDLVIAVQLKLSILLGSVSERLKPKCYGWQHNTFEAYFETPHRYYWKQQSLAIKYLSKLNGCIVLTKEDEKKYKEKLGISATCIYNPVSVGQNLNEFRENKPLISLKKKIDKKIIFVGRLVREQKGLDYLIEIIEKCKLHNYTFEIIGNGPDMSFLQNSVSKNGLDKVVNVLGEQKNLERYYKDADLIISTSKWEGFGLTLVEAMKYGVPFVAFNNNGPSEILGNNNCGILVNKFDTDEFASSISRILDDENIYNVYSQAAFDRYIDFSPAIIAKYWIDFFNGDYNE